MGLCLGSSGHQAETRWQPRGGNENNQQRMHQKWVDDVLAASIDDQWAISKPSPMSSLFPSCLVGCRYPGNALFRGGHGWGYISTSSPCSFVHCFDIAVSSRLSCLSVFHPEACCRVSALLLSLYQAHQLRCDASRSLAWFSSYYLEFVTASKMTRQYDHAAYMTRLVEEDSSSRVEIIGKLSMSRPSRYFARRKISPALIVEFISSSKCTRKHIWFLCSSVPLSARSTCVQAGL